MAFYPSVSKKATWEVELEGGKWVNYNEQVTAKLEDQYNKLAIHMKCSKYTYTAENGETYSIDLIQKKQENVETNKTRKVRRTGPPRAYSGISKGDPNNSVSALSESEQIKLAIEASRKEAGTNKKVYTPLQKVIKRLNSIHHLHHSKKKYAVVLNTGSMNPLHNGHLRMLELGVKELEKHFTVLGGFVSLTHDDHVKFKNDWIPGKNRLVMAQAAVKNHPYIVVDRWEIERNNFSEYFEVANQLQCTLKENFPDIEIKVFYVMGADRHCFAKTCLTHGLGAIVVNRSNKKLSSAVQTERFHLTHNYRSSYFWIENQTLMSSDLSSTTVRNRIRDHESIDDLVPSGVVEYVNNHNITFEQEPNAFGTVCNCKWVFTKKSYGGNSYMKSGNMYSNSSHGKYGYSKPKPKKNVYFLNSFGQN